jgi:hypothetical protein
VAVFVSHSGRFAHRTIERLEGSAAFLEYITRIFIDQLSAKGARAASLVMNLASHVIANIEPRASLSLEIPRAVIKGPYLAGY